MDKNHIIELIKQNRLAEAIELMETMTNGTPLHNELIILASSYSDYSKRNRTAADDIATLERQRSQITNRLLTYLDDVTPDMLQKMKSATPPPVEARFPAAAANPSPTAYPYNSSNQKASPWMKYALIGVGVIVVAIVLMNLPASDTSGAESTTSMEQTAPLPESDGPVFSSPTQSESEEQMGEEEPDFVEEDVLVNGYNVEFLTMDSGEAEPSTLEMVSETGWLESHADGTTHQFEETGRDEWSVYIRDEGRGVNLQLDLYRMKIVYSDDGGESFDLYNILTYGAPE